MNLHITRMRPDDVPECLRIIAKAWDAQTAQAAQDDLRAMFMSPRSAPTFYVARGRVGRFGEDDTVQGIAGYITSWKNWGVLDLIYTAVMPQLRRKGIGSNLVERCLLDADAIDCAVMLTTYVPDFYRPHGFEALADDLLCAGKSNVLMLRRCRSQREAQS